MTLDDIFNSGATLFGQNLTATNNAEIEKQKAKTALAQQQAAAQQSATTTRLAIIGGGALLLVVVLVLVFRSKKG